jgi:acyl dehydratase
LNPADLIGRTWPATQPYTVSREKIAEFARALADPNPAYQGDQAIAPPTLAAVIANQAWQALFDDPGLDVQLKRVIHADQQFEWTRPIRAGDTLVAAVAVEDLKVRGTTEFITLAVRLSTVEGEAVAVSRSSLIHNRPAPPAPTATTAAPAATPPVESQATASPATSSPTATTPAAVSPAPTTPATASPTAAAAPATASPTAAAATAAQAVSA